MLREKTLVSSNSKRGDAVSSQKYTLVTFVEPKRFNKIRNRHNCLNAWELKYLFDDDPVKPTRNIN